MATQKEDMLSGIALYDIALWNKINKYIPQTGLNTQKVYKPDQMDQFLKIMADENNDKKILFPLIKIDREKDFELLSNIKNLKTFNGNKIYQDNDQTMVSNVIPIKLNYQINIFTGSYNSGCEWVRSLLFKLINNPVIDITIPYQKSNLTYVTNIRVLPTISDISDMSQRLYPGQFSCFSIKLELHDANLFNIPIRSNWKIDGAEIGTFVELKAVKDEETDEIDITEDEVEAPVRKKPTFSILES